MARPVLTTLSKSEVEQIHAAALELLKSVGVYFEDAEVAKILLDAGCEQRGSRILIPEHLVEEALKSAPKRFELYDRDGRRVATLGDGALIFNPGSAAVKILDYGSREPRPPTMEDLKKLVILVDYLENLDAQSTALVPHDVPVELRDVARLYPIIKYSRKPIITGAFTVENLPLMLEALRVVREDTWRRPFAIFDVCPSPPLRWSKVTSRNLVDLARAGVPAEIVSMPGLGATAPATVAGAVVLHHAEVLSAVVIAQLVSKGAPVIYGGSPTLTEPRYGVDRIVAPEAVLISLAYRDLARYLELPVHTYMGLSDNKLIDFQAGAESAYSALAAALAGFDVVSGPGMLENESAQSLEKLVLDNEVCGIVKRIAKGFEVDPEHLALDVFRDVVLSGRKDFLAHPHTRKFVRREVLIPRVWDVQPRSRWSGKNIYEQAHEEVEKILKEYTPTKPPDDVARELDRFFEELFKRFGAEFRAV